MNAKGFIVGIYSFISLLIVIICMLLFRKKIYFIRKLWSKSMVKIIGADIEIIGKIDTSAEMIILNHNSMFDIILLDYLYPKDIAWVTNEKLANIPIFGWIFKLPDLILINPKKRSSLKILFSKSKEYISNKRPIGIFPEGTRGNNNEMISFQKGTKTVAEKMDLKIQPIVLINTRDRLDTKKFTSSSGKVKLIYLKAIKPSELNSDWYKEIEEEMKDIYVNNN